MIVPDHHPLGRPLLAVLCYNNSVGAKKSLRRIPAERSYDVVVCDDGSSDDTPIYLQKFQFPVLRNDTNLGIGYTLKRVIKYAREKGYKVLVVMAGNSKDDPGQTERLLKPIYDEGFDYVQGSRRLEGGEGKKTPLFRRVMIPAHAFLFRMLTGFPCTDALNGFRAYKIDLFFTDNRINIWQDWLDRYEFETYVHYKMLSLGYKVKEVPVTKTYAYFSRRMIYSHIRPGIDWWKILRPLVYLKLGIKK